MSLSAHMSSGGLLCFPVSVCLSVLHLPSTHLLFVSVKAICSPPTLCLPDQVASATTQSHCHLSRNCAPLTPHLFLPDMHSLIVFLSSCVLFDLSPAMTPRHTVSVFYSSFFISLYLCDTFLSISFVCFLSPSVLI